jgi:hypothetical protein
MNRKMLFVPLFVLTLASAFGQITPFGTLNYHGMANIPMEGGNLTWTHSMVSSALGVRYKAENLDVLVQYSFAANPLEPNRPRIYFIWTPGDFLLQGGYTETPFTYYSGIIFNSWLNTGYGASTFHRTAQIKLGWKGAYLDLFDPKSTGAAFGDTAPAFTAGYDYKNSTLSLGGGFAGYYINDTTFPYIAYLHGTVKFGKPYIKFNAAFEHDPGKPASAAGTVASNWNLRIPAGDTRGSHDELFEGYIELGFTGEAFTAILTTGYTHNMGEGNNNANQLGAAFSVIIPLHDRIKLMPAIVYTNGLNNTAGSSQGSTLSAGTTFQISF